MSTMPRLQPSLLGRMNERQVLQVLQGQGPLSRAEMARHLGLSAPTVSKAVASLLHAGLLEESAPRERPIGLRATKLRLATQTAQVIGLVLDAGQCLVVPAGLDGTLRADEQ